MANQDISMIAHLMRRAGFDAPRAELQARAARRKGLFDLPLLLGGVTAAAIVMFAVPAPAVANNCIQGCKVPLSACVTVARDARLDCQEACEAIPPGPDRGACMRDCALEGTGAFADCRADFAACRELCISVPIACRAGCVETALACGSGVRSTARECRQSCRAAFVAAVAACVAAGGDTGDCREAAGEERALCLDACGAAQTAGLDACGTAFEDCILACTPPDGDEGDGDEGDD